MAKTQKKRILEELEITAIAAVDKPAQEGAKSVIMKRAETTSDRIAKFLSVADGAKPFSDFLAEKLETEGFWDKRDEVYPFTSALNASIESILVDSELDTVSKNNMLKASIDDFMSSVSEFLPSIEGELTEFVEKFDDAHNASGKTGDSDMPDAKENFGELKKSVEELTSKLEEATTKLEKAEADKASAEALAKMSDAEKAYMTGLKTKKEKEAFAAMDEDARKKAMKKFADADEVLETEGQTIRKSEVGETQFAIMKSQAERLARVEKAREEDAKAIRKAKFETIAKTEFENIPGEVDLKTEMLDAVDSIDNEDVSKALLSILKSHNELVTKSFKEIGGGRYIDEKADKIGKAAVKVFDEKVDEIVKRDSVSRAAAMEKAAVEFPEEFKAYQNA